MDASLTIFDFSCQPLSVCAVRYRDSMNSRAVLSTNLAALMTAKGDTQIGLKRRSGIAQATIGRILRQETAADLDTIAALARAFNLMAWQMLVPDLDPANPPVVRLTEAERELYQRLQTLAVEVAKTAK
jgi:transcriptional regulator with XRE-family HTH domain